MSAHILIVDDDPTQRMFYAGLLRNHFGYTAESVEDGKAALARLKGISQPTVDLVLLDLFMPEVDGRETLSRLRQEKPELPVIMLTGSTEIEDAVDLMRLGASDFLTKPCSTERLRLSIEQHLTIRTLSREVARLRRKEEGRGEFADLVGAEGGLKASVVLGRKAAGSDIAVLITGESGVGKELFARAIHGESARGGKPFIAVNCGAIPENLVESTLFGHEKGSFTGAIAREIGKFREAEGGTLFLDEVGELKPDIQTKLLRVLQQKEIEPVGAGKPVQVNVRILSATHRNLAQDVADKRFREDLFYRLNVLPIHLPPLRERRGDIAALCEHMLDRFCATEQKRPMRMAQDAMEWLTSQPWPGNVRELENLLYRAVVLSDGEELLKDELIAMLHHEPRRKTLEDSDSIRLQDESGQAKSMEVIESEVIAATLKRCGDNVAEAARQLGMGQSTLYKKLSGKAA